MKRLHTIRHKLFAVLLVSLLTVGVAAAADSWLHVKVSEHGRNGDDVSINIPLSLVESLLPMIDSDELEGGIIRLDDFDADGLDLRELLEAVRNAPDANFVTVRSNDGDVRVMKENGYLKVHADDDGDKVRVSLPLEIVDAMLDAGKNELNLLAALEVLSRSSHGDLVTVESDDSYVRIWVDNNPEQ